MEKKIIKIGKYQLDYNPDNEGTRKPPYTITYNKDGRDNAFVVKTFYDIEEAEKFLNAHRKDD